MKSNIFDIPAEILERTFDYADSAECFRWEEYYTRYLTEISKGTVYQYSKRKLARSYLTEGSADKIKATIPNCIDMDCRGKGD